MSRKTINKINKIKVVLVEKNQSNKWLVEQLGKNEATISRWCTIDVQPPLTTLVKIAELLKISPRELLNE